MSSGSRLRGLVATRPRGLVKSTRGAMIHHRDHPSLSRDAEELLFRHAEIITEGEARDDESGRTYFGCTMITCDLGVLEASWRGPFDQKALVELYQAVDGSVRIKLRAMRIACSEVARRIPERPLGTPVVETRVHLTGEKLLLDIDLEVPIGVSSGGDLIERPRNK